MSAPFFFDSKSVFRYHVSVVFVSIRLLAKLARVCRKLFVVAIISEAENKTAARWLCLHDYECDAI